MSEINKKTPRVAASDPWYVKALHKGQELPIVQQIKKP